MKRVLVNKNNTIVFEGIEAKEILRILNAGIYDVSEEDEVKYEHLYRPLITLEELRYEVHFDLKFKGIDDWHRPVFKDINSTLHFGDVDCTKTGKPKDVIDFYKDNLHLLEYFGTSFPCEPHGGKQEFFKFNIIE